MEDHLDETPRCLTYLLGDTPAEEDAFRHRKISEAIGEMILSDEGGRAVALTGRWGSGKSTVVSLLVEFLSTSKQDIKVINFDAWAHEGDPLRRTFLEVAVESLKDWIVDTAEWEKRVKILSKRLIVTQTKSTPKLSVIGLLGAFSLVLSPVAYQLFGVLTKDLKGNISNVLWGLFALASAPLVIAIYILMKWWHAYLHGESQPLPALIYSSSENEVETSSSRSPEPTSVEFEQNYCDLLKEVIGDTNRKVLIVIDNLDRLDEEDAKAVWATMRTFFDKPLRSESWFKKTWILLPFDDSALSIETDGVAKKSPFIEKTFQAFYRVPPPLLTNWTAYLTKQLSVALPNHAFGEDFQEICRIYDHLKLRDASSPTPRELKLFVNKLGALHRQWQHEIPLVTQATFVVKFELSSDEFIMRLQQSNQVPMMPEMVTRRLGANWQRDMAALYYNVPTDKAFEALLAAPVSSALIGTDRQALSKLQNHPGFLEVLVTTLERLLDASSGGDRQVLLNSILGMENLSGEPILYASARRLLYEVAVAIPMWYPMNFVAGSAILSVFKQNPHQPLRPLLEMIERSLPKEDGANNKALVEWVEAVSCILTAEPLKDSSDSADIHINLRPGSFVEIVSMIDNKVEDRSKLTRLIPASGRAEIVAFLSEQASVGIWSETYSNAVNILLTVWTDEGWQDLAEKLAGQFGSVELDSEIVENISSALSAIAHNEIGISLSNLHPLILQSEGLTNLGKMDSVNFIEARAFLVTLLAASNLDLEEKKTTTVRSPQYPYLSHLVPLSEAEENSNRGKRLISDVLSGAEEDELRKQVLIDGCLFLTAGQWRWVAQTRNDREQIAADIFVRALDSGDKHFFNLDELLSNYAFWRELAGETNFSKSLSLLGGDEAACEWLGSKPYDPQFVTLYANLMQTAAPSKLQKMLSNSFNNLVSDDWLSILRHDEARLKLAFTLPQGTLGEELANTLYYLIDEDLHQNESEPLSHPALRIAELLKPEILEDLLQRIGEKFASGSGEFTGALQTWGSLLAKSIVTYGVSKAFDRIVETVSHSDEEELEWLLQILPRGSGSESGAAKLITRLKADVKKEFLSPRDTETPRKLARFAEKMGWRIRV